tara:strand:- start:246 stop:1328 length:1083 start_codon:yes stop_codon:yes gene_type:complete
MAVSRIDEAGLNINQYGNRNLVINGAMQVSQRGTSEASVTSSQYADAPDRFKAEMSSAGTWTLSQSTTAPDGFSNSYKFDCTTADASLGAGDYLQLSHYIEGQNLQHLQKGSSSAKKLTLSFHVRSAKTGTYIVEFYDGDNSRSNSQSYTISAADTWEKKTITIDGDASGAFGNDNGASLGVFFYLAAGTNFTSGTLNTSWGSRTLANVAVGQVNLADSTSNNWYITGVQLEVGDTATDFEHRTFADELQRCQRYYVKFKATSNYSYYGSGVSDTATSARIFKSFPVEMNHVPVLEQSANNTWNIYPPVQAFSANATINNASVWGSAINCTVASGLQPGYCTHCTANNTTDAFFAFESEL